MKRILTVTLLSFSFAAPALAAPASTPNADATRLYVGAQLGDSIVGAMLGLQINRSYALEVRYDYIDTVYQPNTTIRAASAGIAGIGMYPVKFGDMDPFYIFAKAGYERSRTRSTTTDPGIPGLFPATTTVTTTFRNRVVVGAGVQYDFSADVSGRIGMNAVGTDHSVYLSAIYKF